MAQFNNKHILPATLHRSKEDRIQQENRKRRYYALITAYTRKKRLLSILVNLLRWRTKKKIGFVYPGHGGAICETQDGGKMFVVIIVTVRFKKSFKLSRGTFDIILTKISHRLEKQTLTELPLSPEKRLAICPSKLGRGDYKYTVAEIIGIGESTVCVVVKEGCGAITTELWDDYVANLFPRDENAMKRLYLPAWELNGNFSMRFQQMGRICRSSALTVTQSR